MNFGRAKIESSRNHSITILPDMPVPNLKQNNISTNNEQKNISINNEPQMNNFLNRNTFEDDMEM